jgi:hypothetical protein
VTGQQKYMKQIKSVCTGHFCTMYWCEHLYVSFVIDFCFCFCLFFQVFQLKVNVN